MSSLFVFLWMGLGGSFHCALMCGPVHCMVCSLGDQKIRGLFLFHLGRLGAYTALGASISYLSSYFAHGPFATFTTVLMRVISLLLVFATAAHLLGFSSFLGAIEKLGTPVWRWVEPKTRKLMHSTYFHHRLFFGALWAFLPCGLLYSALFMASTLSHFWLGGLGLFIFGLGTLPTLIGLQLAPLSVESLARLRFPFFSRRRINQMGGVALLIVGFFQSYEIKEAMTHHSCCTVSDDHSTLKDLHLARF